MKKCAIICISLSLSFLTAGTAGAVDYEAVVLNPAGFDSSSAGAIADGYQGGWGYDPATASGGHAMLWSGDAENRVDLHPVSGFEQSGVRGMSEGQQVGVGTPNGAGVSSPRTHALLWSGTAESVVDLHPSSGFDWSYAYGISDGQQVGRGWTEGGFFTGHALLWSGTAESVVDLHPATGYDTSYGRAVSDGRQAGFAYLTGLDEFHALLWSGTAESVVDLNPSGFLKTRANGISGNQQVGYGKGLVTTGWYDHALLWSGTAESVVDLHPLVGFDHSRAKAVSNNRQVGEGRIDATGTVHALLWAGTAESALDLHACLPVGYDDSVAYGIDPAGNIVGEAWFKYWDDNLQQNLTVRHAVTWQIPEPASFLLLAAGALALRRRSRPQR